jgi:hypothetical protein
MQQFNIKDDTLNLKVKKSPFLIRVVMFLLSFCFFIFPLAGAIFGIASGNGLHIGYFIGIGICSLIGFYTLRISLWNTYGEETIQIFNDKIIYEANYGWFKDGKKETLIVNPKYLFASIGYEEDYEGVLIIASEEAKVESVVKVPLAQLEELVRVLQGLNSKI